MPPISLDEEPIDDILYLARANETSELQGLLSELSSQTNHSTHDLVAAAVEPHSKNSALHYAAANGHSEVVKLLLSYKQGSATLGLINLTNNAGNTPLHWAALNGHLECVKQLVQAGADVTIINAAGHDAVFEAEINDKKDVVDWLLETVEELEKGFGQTGQSGGDEEDAEEQVGTESDRNASSEGVAEASSADVEHVRRQMEGMETNNGTSQGG